MLIVFVLLWLLLAVFVLVLDRVGLDWFILWLAEHDVWWSPYRMLPSGGHVHFYSKGRRPSGDFATFLYGHIPYYHFHKGDHQFYKESAPEFGEKFPDGPPIPNRRLARLGVGRVGLWRRLYKRKRRWETWDLIKPTKAGEKPRYDIVTKETKEGEEHIFYFSTTMAVGFDAIPTKGFGPTSIGGRAEGKVVFNNLLVHPEKAEFTAGKWELQAVGAVRSRIREYVGNKTIVELQQEQDARGPRDLVDTILLANHTQADETGTIGLIEQHGIQIDSPRFEDFDLVEEEGDKEIADSMRRLTIAQNDLVTEGVLADKAEVRGKGAARELTAKSAGVRDLVAAFGSHKVGGMVALAEAIKETDLKALGGDIMAGIDVEK